VAEGAAAEAFLGSTVPLIAIEPPDVQGVCSLKEKLAHPGPIDADLSHPVNAYLSYAELQIEEAGSRTTAPWLKPIVSAGGKGLIWAGDDGKHRVILIGFGLAASDLPLKVEFPILLANSVTWLSGREDLSDNVVRAGQPVTIRVGTDGGANGRLRITTPDGETEEIDSREGASLFSQTTRTGVYMVDRGHPFAVALLNAAESDTAPRDSIATRTGEITERSAEPTRSESEVWRWAALAALLVLAAEWWAYVRRI
jgi:hypothetical protein